jgi:hypothetical protein
MQLPTLGQTGPADLLVCVRGLNDPRIGGPG